MIIFTIFALFFALFILWRRARRPIAASAAILLWLFAAGWLAAPLMDSVQRDAHGALRVKFAQRTVIVLLGGGTKYDDQENLIPPHDATARIVKTAAVYADCKQSAPDAICTVVVSGGNPQHHEATEADTYAPYLLQLHVAPADMILENTSRTTYENAEHVAQILHAKHYDSLILVTSAYHMHRAMLDFDRFGLAPQAVISNTRKIRTGFVPRLSNLIGANIALHELIGRAQFYAYRAFGWF